MSPPSRRKFVKRAGLVAGAVAVGGSSTTYRSESWRASTDVAAAQEDLPPLRGPYADEDWVEHRGGPGNTKAIDEAPAVDPEEPECSHFYDHAGYSGDAAIADDTMYLVDGQGRIVAIDAHDATERWTSEELGVTGTPALAYHRIVASSDGKLVAFDVDDRSVDWEREFDEGPSSFVVAYESVYAVAEEALYALDVEDGSVRWKRDDEKYHSGVAAGNGEVYATPTSREHGEDYHDVVALDPMTGEDRWIVDRDEHPGYDFWGPVAADGAISVGVDNSERWVFDVETRENIGNMWGFSWAMDDESIVGVDNYSLQVLHYREGESWDFASDQIGRISDPAVAGDTVYVYYGEDEYDDEYEEYEYSIVAFDKQDGEVKWTCEVQESDGDGASIWFDIVATSDAVYVLGDEEIYVVRGGSGGDGEPTPTEEEPTPTEEEPTPTEEEPTPTEGEPTPSEEEPTPTDTEPTPTDSDPTPTDDGGCPTETDGSASCPPDAPTPTDSATVTDAFGSTPTDNDSAVIASSPTDGTDEVAGDGPGLGIVSTITALGGLGYVLRRRLPGGDSSDGSDP